jgi:hypothetical protein
VYRYGLYRVEYYDDGARGRNCRSRGGKCVKGKEWRVRGMQVSLEHNTGDCQFVQYSLSMGLKEPSLGIRIQLV